MSAKKHHFVPQMLLRRFADADEALLVHRLDREEPFTARVVDTAHRNHGHTLFWPHRAQDSSSLESQMSALEGEAAAVLAAAERGRGTEVEDEARETLSWLLALQWTRHRSTLGALRQAVLADEDLGRLDSKQLAWVTQSSGLLATSGVLLDAWAASKDPSSRPKDAYNGVVVALAGFQWRWLRYQRPVLVVSDSTVCLSGVAAGQTADAPLPWTGHGVGVGFATCRRVTVALSPTLGLHLDRDAAPGHMPARVLNQLTVFGSREFVACAPGWPATEPDLYAAMLDDCQRRPKPEQLSTVEC